MKQVFFNVILNAVQAMPDGGTIAIETYNCGNGDNLGPGKNGHARIDPDSIELKFIDTGHGVPECDLDKIFDPFFTTKEKGTGLGLAIVHNIVEAHGGTIQVESSDAKGTIFSIMLPVIKPQ